MTPTIAPAMTQSLTSAQTSLSLLGITIVSLILALFLRRRVPRLAASVSGWFASMRNQVGGRSSRTGTRRGRGAPRDAVAPTRQRGIDLAGLARAALGWIAILLFAVAGVAASGTFIGTVVLWFANLANRFAMWIAGLFPNGHSEAASIGVSLIGLAILALGVHFVTDLIEGKAHHGGRDWLVFAGPMLFTLVPGYFGQWSATAYAAIGAHVGPIVAHLV